jgi:hypothetical protein
MRVLFRTILISTLALGLSACMGSRHYQGPGKYMVQGPGFHIVSGPYPDRGTCHQAIPPKHHSQTYVCIFVPGDPRTNMWKKAT